MGAATKRSSADRTMARRGGQANRALTTQPARTPHPVSFSRVKGLFNARRTRSSPRSRRRQKIAAAAAEQLALRARLRGHSYLEAQVHPGNQRALLFWVAVGFSEVEPPANGGYRDTSAP